MHQNIREINAQTYSTSSQIRIWLRSTSASPKPTLSLPHSHTANRSQRSCPATGGFWKQVDSIGRIWNLYKFK